LNFVQAALRALMPDRIPASRRSLASSIFAFAGPLGTLVGVNVVALVPDKRGYAALAVLLTAATAAFVLFAREEARLSAAAPAGWRSLRLSWSLLESFASRDYSFAYAFRILMFVAQFSINNYLLYILQDHIGLARLPGRNAQIAAGALTSLRTAATIVAIFLGLWFAHRTERRKSFALIYAVGMAAAMLVPVLSPTWPGMLIFAALGGLAMGVYSTIDLDLMSRVLPSKDSAGRDLALLVMAGAAAQFLAPPLAGALIRTLGYDALFVVAAGLTLLAGAVTSFIRGVR
jgi:predicted MFS family arabinose efflux permease